jgi:DNA-binding MarR family transcriptional regulator
MKKIEDVILFQIDLTSKVSKQYSQREFNNLNLGITVEQWVVLKIVSESSNLSQKELAEKSFRDADSITRTLDLLEKKEYLFRKSIPNNRIAYEICLSEKGEQCIKDNIELIYELRKLSTQSFRSEELEVLSSYLERIMSNMS